MKRNSRLSLALHTLSHMAVHPERVQTSAEIADHAGTNAVVVRRVLGPLKKHGLLTSEKGHAGGWRLSRPPQDITLADVYCALDEKWVSSQSDPSRMTCAVEHALHRKVAVVLDDLEETLVAHLSKTTIADVGDT